MRHKAAFQTRELSWLGFGETRASFSIQDHDLAVGLDGSQQELTFWQERNAKTNLFSGLHLINQEFSIIGGQSNSQTYDLEYRSLSILYSFGYDWLIGDFLHIQPYAAYGLGQGSFRLAHKAKDVTQRAFPKKKQVSQTSEPTGPTFSLRSPNDSGSVFLKIIFWKLGHLPMTV